MWTIAAPPDIAIVLPCFNEEETLPGTYIALTALMDDLVERQVISGRSRMWFVDDGSRDSTWDLIQEFAHADARVHGLRLSRNCGHQNAILSGMLTAQGDCIITIDADLQDDISCIERMVAQHRQGVEIVLGVRNNRDADTWLKRTTANAYYLAARHIGMKLVHGHADFRLMGRASIEALREYGERNLFLRGLIPELGFRTGIIEYARLRRRAGTTKYTWRKMFGLSLDGITSFSVVPLRLIAILGLLIFLFSLVLVSHALASWFLFSTTLPGWASITVPMYALGGLQLLAMGVIGEYISKIYLETKRRPRYIIESRTDETPLTAEAAGRITQTRRDDDLPENQSGTSQNA